MISTIGIGIVSLGVGVIIGIGMMFMGIRWLFPPGDYRPRK